MKSLSFLAGTLLAAAPAAAADSPIEKLATEFSRIARELGPEAGVKQDRHAVRLTHKARKFMVHGGSKIGRYAKDAHETTGPSFDGIIVTVRLQENRYAGAAVIPQDIRSPYWTTFVNAYPLSRGRQHLHLSISYGAQPNAGLIEGVKNLLADMVDDAPPK